MSKWKDTAAFLDEDVVEFVGIQGECRMPWHPKVGTAGVVKGIDGLCLYVLWDTDDLLLNPCWINMDRVIKVDKADCCASKELDDLFSEF